LKKKGLISLFILLTVTASAQPPKFSFGTDADVIRSFKKEQKFWSIGQTIVANIHFTKKNTLYIWAAYTGNGRFENQLVATAKSPTTTPTQLNYKNSANMKGSHISIGLKHYFRGHYFSEQEWNLYGGAGFGLKLGKIENKHSIAIDTATYDVPVLAGNAKFKRLTFDLMLGFEQPLGGAIYFYAEAKLMIPTTDYPSPYILINENAPLTGSVNLGLRLFFD